MPLPLKSTLMLSTSRDKDVRGSILSIVDEKVSNVSIIECEPRTIRSNHYHLEDFHFMYVLSGQIDYFYRNITTKKVEYIEVLEGQTIFTPKKELHATYFPVRTTLIVSSKNPRDQATYERDTVRETLITLDNIKSLKQSADHGR